MFIHNINPVLLSIGGLQIRYYGLFYALGALIVYLMLAYPPKYVKRILDQDQAAEFITVLLISEVIGARLGYVLFYNLSYYLSNPLEILMVWHGGLSFHGGLIGAVAAALWWCKRKKVSFYALADMVMVPLALALALGRIANFINGELYGRITTVPWAVKFPNAEGYRHPSQLYESAYSIFIFLTLWFLRAKAKLKEGVLFWSFIVLYAVLRFLIEFFREPDAQLGFIIMGLTMGQLLCIAMFIVGISFLYPLLRKQGMDAQSKDTKRRRK